MNLLTRRPQWQAYEGKACGYSRTEKKSEIFKNCNVKESPAQFKYFSENKVGSIIGLALSAGLVTTGSLKFNEEQFQKAYLEAEKSLTYQGLSGRKAVEKLLNESTKVQAYKISELQLSTKKIHTLSAESEEYDIAVSFNPKCVSHIEPEYYYQVEMFKKYVSNCLNEVTSITEESERLNRLIKAAVIKKQKELISHPVSLEKLHVLLTSLANHRFSDKTIVEKAKKLKEKHALIAYEKDYKSASSLFDYEKFITKYNRFNFDPKSYIKKLENKIFIIKKNAFIARVKAFRKSLSEGDVSHCGLVVNVRDKLAQVQTMNGLHFILINQIYPDSLATCLIRNNIYQPPKGLGI